jgi:lipopolysaccharide export system permease protein
MKILQKYVARELWLPFALCFFTLNFIFMAAYLVRAANFIIGRGVPLLDTLWVLILALPEMVSYTAPTSLLTAVLIVFGGLSQNNEIRAMKASGIHPIQIMTPAFLVGLVLSFVMFVFNDQITTNASFEVRRVTKKILIKHPAAIIEPGRFVKLNDSVIFLAKELKGNHMRDIVAYENEGSNKPIRTIIAERGEIVKSKDNSELQIRLYDGSVSDAEDSSVQSIQFKTYEFPTVGQEDIRQMQKKMRDLSLAELAIRSRQPGIEKSDRRQIWTAFHQRIAFAFGSFIFVLVGIPIAILVQRGEIVLSFAISMAAASLYYVLFVGAKTISMSGIIPAMIVFWLPNLLLMALGVYLLKRSLLT